MFQIKQASEDCHPFPDSWRQELQAAYSAVSVWSLIYTVSEILQYYNITKVLQYCLFTAQHGAHDRQPITSGFQ